MRSLALRQTPQTGNLSAEADLDFIFLRLSFDRLGFEQGSVSLRWLTQDSGPKFPFQAFVVLVGRSICFFFCRIIRGDKRRGWPDPPVIPGE
jgi:hypothetical protein